GDATGTGVSTDWDRPGGGTVPGPGTWREREVSVTAPATGQTGVTRFGKSAFLGRIGESSAGVGLWMPDLDWDTTIDVGGRPFLIHADVGGFVPINYPWLTLDEFTGLVAVIVSSPDDPPPPPPLFPDDPPDDNPGKPFHNPEPTGLVLAALAAVGGLGAGLRRRVLAAPAAA